MEPSLGLAEPTPELVWGFVSRGVGLTFLIAFLSLRPQLLEIAGEHGLLPIREALRVQARDFPSWKRFVYFPTLLWIDASDRTLSALVWLGILASVSIVAGGPHVPYAFALCFVAYLSLDRAMTLIYPWEALLFEAGLWAALLPATQLLPQWSCASAPSPAVAWAFRLLAFRVLFGFGKHKFAGSTPQDVGFLRGFLASQPLPTYVGWYAQKLPLGALKLGLFGLFVVEIIAPFAAFVPGPFASLAALASIGLMLGIWAGGNYGHFNLILSAVVLSWFDHASARSLSLASLATPIGCVFALHTLLALYALPFNTFCSFSWTLWSPWRRLRSSPLTWPITLARWLAPFRVVHPYGVFPPQSPPPVRITPVSEVSWDGSRWHELSHPYWPTRESSPPRFCAPHHERVDQAVVYEALGLTEQSLYRGAVGRWDPYGHGGLSAPQRLVHRILAGGEPALRFYARSLERQRGAPLALRVRIHLLEPASREERAARGIWWRRELLGPHIPPQRLTDMFVEHPLPPPELWHFEDVYWLERSRLGQSMRRVARGEDPHRLIDDGAPELTPELVQQFWTELVPWLRAQPRDSFRGLRARVEGLRVRYGRPRLYSFERLAGRYGALLFARLEPQLRAAGVRALFRQGPQAHAVNSLYELRLLTHHIVAEGKPAYDAVVADPELASEHAAALTMYTGHTFQAAFRYEALVSQSQKLRLLDAMTKTAGRPEPNARQRAAREKNERLAKRVFGAITVVEFLKTQFLEVEDVLDIPEDWPSFTFTPEGEIVRVQRNS